MVNEEEKYINVQIYALIFTFISTFVSLLLTYNQKLELQGKDTLFDSKTTFKITKSNRILFLIISLVFLYVNYKLYNISKREGEDLKPYVLQIFASILTISAAIVALYVVSLSNKGDVADIENPII